MIGGGAQFQVSGLGRQVPGSGVQVRVQVQEICHPSSATDSVIFQFQVAGGGTSALRHRFSHLSSIQPSIQSSTQPHHPLLFPPSPILPLPKPTP